MTKISELKNKKILDQKVEVARRSIFNYVKESSGEEGVQQYLTELGLDALVQQGKLPNDVLAENLDEENLEKIKDLDPPITETGYFELVNSFAIVSYDGILYGVFYFSSDRAGKSTTHLMDDVESMMNFSYEGQDQNTIELAMMFVDQDVPEGALPGVKLELI